MREYGLLMNLMSYQDKLVLFLTDQLDYLTHAFAVACLAPLCFHRQTLLQLLQTILWKSIRLCQLYSYTTELLEQLITEGEQRE